MLVLTRKVGERIAIGQQAEILITVVGIRGGRVQLGIDADLEVPVQRVVSTPAAEFPVNRSPREMQHVLEFAH